MQCTTARPQNDLAHKQIKAKKQTGRLLPAGRNNSALSRGQDQTRLLTDWLLADLHGPHPVADAFDTDPALRKIATVRQLRIAGTGRWAVSSRRRRAIGNGRRRIISGRR